MHVDGSMTTYEADDSFLLKKTFVAPYDKVTTLQEKTTLGVMNDVPDPDIDMTGFTCTINDGPPSCTGMHISAVEDTEVNSPYSFDISCVDHNGDDCATYFSVWSVSTESRRLKGGNVDSSSDDDSSSSNDSSDSSCTANEVLT